MTRPNESFPRKFWKTVLLIVLLPVLLPFVLIVLAFYVPYRTTMYLLVWALWVSKGKDVLFVYSDSPIWQEYMLTQILPLVRERAVIMNWSERSKWPRWSFRVHVFRSFRGYREFNPLVIVFRPWHRARKFRFWRAFKDWKHGNQQPVSKLRKELAATIQSQI
jgi:hypothetical protein